MKKWMLKALVQKTISYLPYRNRINLWFQRNITKGVSLSETHFRYKLEHARDHLLFFSSNNTYLKEESRVLELGTGWYPVVPLALYLSGYDEIVSVDLNAWLKKKGQITAIRKYKEWREAGKLDTYLEAIDETRWQSLMHILDKEDSLSFEEINAMIRLTPRVENLITSNLPDASFDYICSNNTFEHVYKEPLKGILKRMAQLIKKGGTMSHFIDMSDHFAHFDKSITVYNFLKYSDKTWQRIDNPIQPQNRLRLSQFRKIYGDLGIPITEEFIRPFDVSTLSKIKLHASYADFEEEDLATVHAYLVSYM